MQHHVQEYHLGLRVILWEPDGATRMMINSALTLSSFEVTETKNANQVVEYAREERLQAVLLDLDIPQRDAIATARILKKNPQTCNVPVIILCQRTADKNDIKELVGYGISGVLLKPIDPEAMIQKLQDLSDKQLQNLMETKEKNPFTTVHLEDNPSLLVRQVQCPFHEEQSPFYYYILRSGCMGAEMTFFDIPRYTEPAKGCLPVNYHLLSVIGCPVCHFASNDPDYFLHPGAPNSPKPSFDPPVIKEIMKNTENRKKLLAGVQADYYTSRRGPATAITAYRVAIECSQELYACSEHNFALELSRIGNYHLRIAMLLESLKRPQQEIDAEIRAAHERFKEGFMYVHGPAFFRNIYQLAATGIYLGDDKTAYTYIQRM